MADAVHIMSEPAPHEAVPTSAPSRRRALFAAAGAVVMGSGIAASITDFIPSNPDAELIAIGVEAARIRRQHAALMVRWWDMQVGDAGLELLAAQMEEPYERTWELSKQARALRATTPDGMKAKAELIRHFLTVECETEKGMVFNSPDQELLWSLICDMTGGEA